MFVKLVIGVLLFVFLIFVFSNSVSACPDNQHPCLLFNQSEITNLWSKLQASQFSGRIPSSTSNFSQGISAGSASGTVPEGAALRCLLNPSATAGSTECSSAKANLM